MIDFFIGAAFITVLIVALVLLYRATKPYKATQEELEEELIWRLKEDDERRNR